MLLGFKLSLVDIAGLGWLVLGLIVAIVLITFGLTFAVGRLFRLPGDEPLLIAAGFSICGVSAIGAMSGVTRSRDDEQATPVALVTLCGTLAIAVLPLLAPVFGLDARQFGMWTGASVHDVGQVVATRPPLVPLFLVAFLAAVLARTVLPLPAQFLSAADDVQLLLLGMALFGIGSAIRIGNLVRTGARSLAVAMISWTAVAGLALLAVYIGTAAGVPALS